MDFGEENEAGPCLPHPLIGYCVRPYYNLCVLFLLELGDFSATVLCDFSVQRLLWLLQVLLNFPLL